MTRSVIAPMTIPATSAPTMPLVSPLPGMNEEPGSRADSNLEVEPALERGQQFIEVGAPRGTVSVLVEHMHPVLVVGDDERIQ